MKKIYKIILAISTALLIIIPSSYAVFYYTQPISDASYPLLRLAGEGKEAVLDGWTFYTDENGVRKELTPDGTGGYTGLDYSGQTFYYSQRLTQQLASPTLKINAANRTVSVFLDSRLIYTDCPMPDNRIGNFTLPMPEYDRAEPVTISLPPLPDFYGKMLTIAQSTPVISETQEETQTVFPCEITLYCGYAYESSLIASAVRTIIPSVLLFSLLLFLLASFIRNAYAGILSPKPVVFALTVLFQMCSVLSSADFFYEYFGAPDVDWAYMFFHLSVASLLLFLTLHASSMRLYFSAITLFEWSSIFISFLIKTDRFNEYGNLYVFCRTLPQLTGFFALTLSLTGACILGKKGNRFFIRLMQAVLFLAACYGAFLAVNVSLSADYASRVFERLHSELKLLLPNYSLQLLWSLCLLSTLFSVFIEFSEQIAERRAEAAVLSVKNRLALESYENLRLQSEETMMLRHDTKKHYRLLRSLASENPKQLIPYLDELIGAAEQIRPVISCRNKTLEILLNGKLNTAASKGISVSFNRCSAPENLPLSDAKLCSLISNILDNAIYAAERSEAAFIRLDFFRKEQFFIFSCKNSMPEKQPSNRVGG